jgi:hypothetical protein
MRLPSGNQSAGYTINKKLRLEFGCMKITIDVPEKELQDAVEFTGARSKREAVVTALVDFNRHQRLERLVQQFGTFDGFMTQKELRRMRRAS